MPEHDTPSCVSCGMPMRTVEEHAAADPSKDFCHHCAREDGRMKSYEEVLTGFAGFLQHTQGLQDNAARDVAAQILSKQPAWNNR
ncbi:zinc ribbon domain-containing protein [Streptomyces sp. NPDC051776]|uniref:zinc ribbon domain-containing protein n=1 Tax=Streptomyces sp. NPDC051776 TaxID=3155414 RepID=UPI00342BDD5D